MTRCLLRIIISLKDCVIWDGLKFIIKNTITKNIEQVNGWISLLVASKGHLEMVKILIVHSDFKDAKGQTVFDIADKTKNYRKKMINN